MGLLDPKLDKERTFELLKKKGAVKAVLQFSGGHDEGSVESITLTLADGSEVDLPTWYCGGYRLGEKTGEFSYEYVPLSTPANEDEELADLLEGPINENFGSWGDVPSTEGALIWDVEEGTAELQYDQETWDHMEVTY
jgi:hypothetical protein